MKEVIIYSGGMDSFTLLNQLLTFKDPDVYALTFYYRQKHNREIGYAKQVCEELKINHKIVSISSIGKLLDKSALTGNFEMPKGSYNDENMRLTVVPNRNMILLSIAIGYAITIGSKAVYYAAHAGDHAIYPDCRQAFVLRMNEVNEIANYSPALVYAPYIQLTKADIVKKGIELGLDYSKSWTCYEGREKACGKCGSCNERLEAFGLNNMEDPLEYE